MLQDLLAQTLQITEGTVLGVGSDGHVEVDLGGDAEVAAGADESLRCRLLQTAEAPPLMLAPGETVLVAALPGTASGFVLGRVALHTAAEGSEAPAESDTGAESAPEPTPGRHVEIVMPEGVETVRIAGRRVRIAADEELTLECGGALVRIDRNGKVVVLGNDITSRARRLNKVKGARVAIN